MIEALTLSDDELTLIFLPLGLVTSESLSCFSRTVARWFALRVGVGVDTCSNTFGQGWGAGGYIDPPHVVVNTEGDK